MSVTYEQERTEEQRQVDAYYLNLVKQGIAWLEENYGPNWAGKIDMETLNLRAPNRCVLGQVFAARGRVSGFGYAIRTLQAPAEDCGFSLPPERAKLGYAERPHEWDKLQEAWEYALTRS